MTSIIFIETPVTLQQRYGEMATAAHLVPPLGLMPLAAVAREAGYNTDIIDAPALGYGLEDILREIEKVRPQFVGLTSATVGFDTTMKMAKEIKTISPDTTIIIGGVHASIMPAEVLTQFPQIDIVCIGEGEDTLLEILDYCINEKPLREVKGIAFREGAEVLVNERRPLIKDLDRLPYPAYDLVPDLSTHYHPAPHIFRRFPSTTISTSRGCFGQCTFCDRTVFGNKCRAFSAEYLIGLITFLVKKYGLKDIWIGDDLFVMFRSRLKKFCELVIAENLDLTWACCARVGMLKPDLLALMKQAGCYEVAFGIESGSQKMLDFLKKNIKLEDVERDLEWTKAAGIRTMGTFMIGLPNETKETMEASISFAKRVHLDMLQLSFFTPFPGTELSHNIEQYGQVIGDYSKMNVFGNVVFVPHGLTKADLIKYYKKFYREFYLRPKTVFSFIKDLERPKDLLSYMGGAFAVMKIAFSRKKNNY